MVLSRAFISGLARLIMPKGAIYPLPCKQENPSQHTIWLCGREDASPKPYALEEFERIFNIHYTHLPVFENFWTYQAVLRASGKTKDAATEPKWWGSYYHKELDTGYVAPVYVAWAGNEKRWGLFAREALSKDAFVGEYAGKVKLVSFFFNNLTPYCFHYPLPLRSWLWFTIDPAVYGKETRFMNHSENANCRSVVMYHQGIYRVGICTERDIRAGEELTFNYGLTVWGQPRKF